MTKWIIKHYNVITLCLAIVTLYLLVQFLQEVSIHGPNVILLGWVLMNFYLNLRLCTHVDKLLKEVMDAYKVDDYNELEGFIQSNLKIAIVAYAYFFLFFALLLLYIWSDHISL